MSQNSMSQSDKIFDSAWEGDERGLAMVLAAGVSIDVKDEDGGTAAICEAEFGTEKCLGLLIAGGEALDAKKTMDGPPP